MNYAIIAAGEGSRLYSEGVRVPKPLVSIAGQTMLERLVSIFRSNDAENVSVILREDIGVKVPADLIYAATPSSMHSLYELSRIIPEGRIVVTTVDTIFDPEVFSRYIGQCRRLAPGEALFAVTPYIDDEKPLWVATEGGMVTGFFDKECDMPEEAPKLVSGGIYCMDTETAWPVLRECMEQGVYRMRNFQRALIASGVLVRAFVFDKIFDIDHKTDIEKANKWLNS